MFSIISIVIHIGSGCTRVAKIAEWQRILIIKIQSL